MDTEEMPFQKVSPTASVSSIVDSNNKTNLQNEAQESSDDKVTEIVSDTKTESLKISAKAIERLESTDLSEKTKSSSSENTSNEYVIDVDESELRGKN